MISKGLAKYILFCWFLVLEGIPALAQPTVNPIRPLHPALGDLVDARENARYRIIGPVEHLFAVRLHEYETNRFRLHILFRAGNAPVIRLLPLSLQQLSQLRSQLDRRIRRYRQGQSAGTDYLLSIPEQHPGAAARQEFILYDGSTLNSVLSTIRGDTLVVKTLAGVEITIPDGILKMVRPLKRDIPRGRFQQTDPNQTRLFFSPTGRPLKQHSGYFADYYVFFPTLAYGLTANLSISGGVSIIPGATSQLMYIAPRFALTLNRKVSLAAGFLTMGILNQEERFSLGYLVTTFGDAVSAVTLGIGIPLHANSSGSLLLIGGEMQISNHVKLITENWVFAGNDLSLLYSAGIRFFGQRLAVDLALVGFDEFAFKQGFPLIPYVDFSVFFGH